MMGRLIVLSVLLSLAACSQGPDSPRGFSLPEGNVERGEAVFKAYDCLACHKLQGYSRADVEKELETPVKLGGEVVKTKTYAELVTGIINPSHRISSNYDQYSQGSVTDEQGQSKMRNYNDVMTVSELVDLVAFLETHYELNPYAHTNYQLYHP